jgi:hypothetical protein
LRFADNSTALYASEGGPISSVPEPEFTKFNYNQIAGSAYGGTGNGVYDVAKSANWTNPDGSTWWPENYGFKGSPSTTTLQPGIRIDRYGYTTGFFTSPEGTSYGARSLPPGSINTPYNSYEVIKPFDVQSGTVAPWFDQPGGGIQYQLPMSVQSLLDQGFIR